MSVRTAAAAAGTAAAGYGVLQWLGRTYGATRDERRRALPGDDLVVAPQATTTHAVTIDAPPEHVWPWLVQMGWGRGQWYTARWVDRLLFPNNGPSADCLVPEWQHLEVGDRVLDGAPDKKTASVRLPQQVPLRAAVGRGVLPGRAGPRRLRHVAADAPRGQAASGVDGGRGPGAAPLEPRSRRPHAGRHMRISVPLAAAALPAYVLVVRPWMMRWGSTDQERAASLPGDGGCSGALCSR